MKGTPKASILGSKPSPAAPPPITVIPRDFKSRINPARKLYKVQAQRDTNKIFFGNDATPSRYSETCCTLTFKRLAKQVIFLKCRLLTFPLCCFDHISYWPPRNIS